MTSSVRGSETSSFYMGNTESRESGSEQENTVKKTTDTVKEESTSRRRHGSRHERNLEEKEVESEKNGEDVEENKIVEKDHDNVAQPSRKKKRSRRTKDEHDEPKLEVHPPTDSIEPAGEPEIHVKEKRSRRKRHRQTSQEEESAQALLALNKGVSSAGDENAIDDSEGFVEDRSHRKSRKKKSKSKKKVAIEPTVLEEPEPEQELNGMPTEEDVEMAEAAMAVTAAAAPRSQTTDEVERAGTSDGIPESNIISQHLAAHMSKIASPPVVQDDLEHRLAMHLQQNLQQNAYQNSVLDANGFVSVNRDLGTNQQLPETTDNRAPVKKRKRVTEGSPANVHPGLMLDPQLMQLDEAAGYAVEAVNGAEAAKAPKKKRRTAAGDAQNTLAAESAVADSISRRKPTLPGEVRSNWGNATASTGEPPNGGTFSLNERYAVDEALKEYRESNDLTMDQLRDRVWGNQRRKDDFWDRICSAVPNRSRASVYKHVRRCCHIFQQRAKWTNEEDDELAGLVAEKGNKWKEIGQAMGRMGEDCRDRYRNYVKCGKDRGKDRWSDEEETLLIETVLRHKEVARALLEREGKPIPPPEEEDSVLINWTTVSDQMQNRRSRIQCRYKWKKMIAQREKAEKAPIGVTYEGGKRKKLAFDISQMLPGDKYWLLRQIRNSGASQENEILWDEIAKNDKDVVGIWTHKDLKAAYKAMRAPLPYRRRPLDKLISEILADLEQYPPEQLAQRFVPSDQQYPQQPQQQPQPAQPAPVAAMVDPGLEELEKTAGEAIAFSAGLEAAARVARTAVERANEEQVRQSLGAYLQAEPAT